MSNEENVREELIAQVEALRGPEGWKNWQALRLGMPRRTEHIPGNLVLRPIWQEFALHSDTSLGPKHLRVGPFDFVAVDPNPMPSIGRRRRVVLLRQWDHGFDTPYDETESDGELLPFVGGGADDEMAALLGLALGRRFRSGGSVRTATAQEVEPIGSPDELDHQDPALESPQGYPMLPRIVDEVSLTDAKALLELYPMLDAGDAAALVRSARQYVDGLWLADGDPRLAWIKLVGALEAAANRRDDARHENSVAQLKRHKPALHRRLAQGSPETLEAVADEVARLFWQASKVWSFVKAFDPGPPPDRPSEDLRCVDWSRLEEATLLIYDLRSRDLHDGVPWPWSMCEPPGFDGPDTPNTSETVAGVYTGHDGRFVEGRIAMQMHVFAYLVGGALRNWWRFLGEQSAVSREQRDSSASASS